MSGPAEVNHGPMFIGTVFNILLFGIMVTQVYIYYTSYRRDRIFLKLIVLAVFLVDTVNTVFDVTYMYVCLILHFGDADYLTVTNWQFATDPALTGVISLMVQLFFVWRIHVLTKNWFLVTIVTILALASGICAFVTSWEVTVIPQFARFQNFRPCRRCGYHDYYDSRVAFRKRKTGFKASDMIIDRIIRMTVQTGLITSVVATVDLTVYLADSSGLHLLFNFALCKLYSNSLMSSLNSRGRWGHDDLTFGNVVGHSRANDYDDTINFWQGEDVGTSREAREKRRNILESVRKGVIVHVESSKMRDTESHGEGLGQDLQGEKGLVVIPAGTDYGTQTQNEPYKESPV